LISLKVSLALICREDKTGCTLPLDRGQDRYCRRADRPDIFARLGVPEAEAAMLEVDLVPFEAGDLLPAAAGEHPEAHDVEGFPVDPLFFHLPHGLAKPLHFSQREEAILMIVGLSDRRCLAWVALDDLPAPRKAEDGGKIAENLARCAFASTNDDPLTRADLVVPRGLASFHIPKEPFDIAGVHFRHPALTEQWHNMVAEPGHPILLGQRLHRRPLTLTPLGIAALLLIEIDQVADPHFFAFVVARLCRILADHGLGEKLLCLAPCHFHGQGPETSDRHVALGSASTSTFSAVSQNKAFRSANANTQAEPRNLAIPDVIALLLWGSGVNDTLREMDCALRHFSSLSSHTGDHRATTKTGNRRAFLDKDRVTS